LFISTWWNRQHTTRLYEAQISINKRTDYLEKQITEFYGPISAMLAVQKELLKTRWDPDTRTTTGQITDEMWHELRDEVMIPNAQAIADIVTRNFHLIEGEVLPGSYLAYLLHARLWALSEKHAFDKGRYLENFSFPVEFADEINATAKRLKKQYYQLMRRP
jgi:hypothetical protein